MSLMSSALNVTQTLSYIGFCQKCFRFTWFCSELCFNDTKNARVQQQDTFSITEQFSLVGLESNADCAGQNSLP